MRKPNIISITILICILTLFIGSTYAVELHKELHSEWYMLTCAGFGYRLKLNNDNNTFRLEYGDECPSVITSFFKGKFKFVNNKLELDFGNFTAKYYLKMPYAPVCDNTEDSLNESELKLVCHEEYLDSMDNFSPKGTVSKRIFLKKPGLFLEKINIRTKDKNSTQLIKDLSTHVFSIHNY